MNILSPVEKLIHYRKLYKISQQELVKDKIARSYLAMIESRRKKLNTKIANILVENFNSILDEKGVSDNLTVEYLLEDKESQITKITNKLLKEISENNLEEITLKIDKLFLEEVSPENKKKLYIKLGNTYFSEKKFEQSNKYFMDLLPDLIQNTDIILLQKIVLKITLANMELKKYNENIKLKEYIRDSFNNFSKEIKMELLYNFALSYFHLKYYKNALDLFKILEKSAKNIDESFNMKLLTAKCNENLGNLKEVLSIYRGSLLKFKENEKKLKINFELLKLFNKKDDLDKIKLYLRKVVSFLNELKNSDTHMKNLDEIYFVVGDISKTLQKRKQAINYFLSVIDNTESYELKHEAIKEVIDILRKNNLKEIKKLEEKYFEAMRKVKRFDVGFKFITFYSECELDKNEKLFVEKMKKFL